MTTKLARVFAVLLPALVVVSPEVEAKRNRSSSARRAFIRVNPCPAGPDQGSRKRCRGHVVDHVCPLACGGADAPVNMQWQTVSEAKAKDRWELSCSTCEVR